MTLATGNTRAQELRAQGLLLDRLSGKFDRRMRREISATMREMIAFWEITGEVPTARDHIERVEALYASMAGESIRAFSQRIKRVAKVGAGPTERKDFAAIMRTFALRYVASEAIRQRITDVSEGTRASIVDGVRRGYEDGLGQAGIGALILENVPSISVRRANMIARTETHGAANAGADAAIREEGLEYRREWMAGSDARTRDSHRRADGQDVGADEPFSVGGTRLMYPGDPGGRASETINCRCAVAFVIV
jgi:uncharacterized protein with gpF-like domain